MTQVVMVIMASERQVKNSIKGLPFSPIIAKVTPRNTIRKEMEDFDLQIFRKAIHERPKELKVGISL